jgi:hypothetical protein
MTERIPQETLGRIALLSITLLLLLLKFPDFFEFDPNKVIEPYSDGLKAYTNIEYHAKHDSSYTYFEGMNYPYGDHLSAAVAQPLVSNTLKALRDLGWDVTRYSFVIVNMSLLLGLLLGAYFLYLCFRKLELPVWLAVLGGISLAFFSPQLHRWISHYGLSHIEVFPILFYLLMRLEEEHELRWSFWVAVLVFLSSLIHFYYFAILAMTLSLYFFVGFLRKPSVRRLLRYAMHFGVQIGLPLVFFYWWMYAGEKITDRSGQPWGFFHFHAIWETVVTNYTMPHFAWIDENLIPIQRGSYEGQAYIGLVALIGFVSLTIRWVRNRFQHPFVLVGGTFQPFLNKMLLAGFILLLLSFGYPFTIPGLEWLLDYTGPFQQFRSVGRFNWPFFYIVNVVVLAELWHWAKDQDWRKGLLAAALLVLLFETYHHATQRDLRLDELKWLKEGQRFTDIDGIDYDDFQAVLPAPYFNLGSDQYWYDAPGNLLSHTLVLGVQTGLPTTGAALTRTSRRQAFNQLQLATEPYRLPAILKDFPNEKPLMLLVSKEQFEKERDKYKHLLENVYLLYENDELALYRMPLRSFQARIDSRVLAIEHRLRSDSLNLYELEGFRGNQPKPTFAYHSFDTLTAKRVYQGGGAFEGDAAEKNVIHDGQLPNQYGTGWYTFSAWVFVDEDRLLRGSSLIEEYEPETGNVVKQQGYVLHQHISVMDSNGWALLEFPFVPDRSDTAIRWSIQQADLPNTPIFVDELLIRQDVNELFKLEEGYVFKNNRWYKQ